MATSFPQFKNWSDKDVQRLFRQRDSIRDKNRAQYQGFNDDYYKNTMSFKPLLDALKPTHKRIKKIKDLAKDFKLKLPEHIDVAVKSFNLDDKFRVLAMTLNSIPNDPVNVELKQDIVDNVFGPHRIAEQEAFIDGYMARGESIFNNSDLPTEQLYPSASEFVRDDRIPIASLNDDFVRDDRLIDTLPEERNRMDEVDPFESNIFGNIIDQMSAVFGWIYGKSQYADELEQSIVNVVEVRPELPPGGPPIRLDKMRPFLNPTVPRPLFSAGFTEKLKGDPVSQLPTNVPDIVAQSQLAPDIQNLINKEGKLIAQEEIEDLLNLQIQEDQQKFAERIAIVVKNSLLGIYPSDVVDIITSYWTDEDYIVRDMLALVINNLRIVGDLLNTRRAQDVLGYTDPFSIGFNENGQMMFLNEPVEINGRTGHLVHNGKRYKLNLNLLKLLFSYNPFVINEMTDLDTRSRYLGIVKAMSNISQNIKRLVQENSIQGTKLGEILNTFREQSTAPESTEGQGYKSQMKLKKQIQTLHRRSAKRRAVKSALRSASDKARSEQGARDFAPLIDEIRKIERQIHDTSRTLKGKPAKVRDGTANVSKKTGRIKRHIGKGGFGNSDAFFTGSKRKSVRVQAAKQVKDRSTFGSGLPSLENKLMLLKGSQMAGNTGKKIKAEISKIEKKLK